MTIPQFRRTIWQYYRRNGRALPWRETSDPYQILVSEIMLQQTQVPRVIEKYKSFLKRFPTVRHLARAKLSSVLKEWQGLGYNRRAMHLWKAARIIVRDHHSKVPADTEKLDSLPGVGHATASAIMAYAFNEPVAFIETNIRSIFIHFFFADKKSVHDHELLPLIEQSIDRKNPREWYWALMDYGTYLKSLHPNPSRKSAQYAKQSVFKGSRRQIRGQIVRLVVTAKSLPAAELYKTLPGPQAAIRSVLRDLMREGLLTTRKSRITVTSA